MRRNWEDFVGVDKDGRIIERDGKLNIETVKSTAVSRTLDNIAATPTAVPGNLNGTEDGDLIALTLNAGQTYTFDFRGLAGGLSDPYLFLLGGDLSLISQDDDGGAGTSSMITFTPTTGGTYYLYATSYTAASGGSPGADFGDYTINMWSPEADVPGSTNVVASLPTAVTIGAGTTFGNMEAVGDNDYFAVNVTAGMVYSFAYSGGVSGLADRNQEPGENLARLTLYNAAGTQLSTNFNYESGTSYFAATSGTIYLRAQSLEGTGGYTLDVSEIDPATRDPLQSLNWDTAANIDTIDENGAAAGGKVAYVYFGAAGENFGEAVVNMGWQPHQIAGVMNALTEYTPITGIEYRVTTDVTQAEFRMITVATATYGARFYPQDPQYGTQQGIGTFNLQSGGFGTRPESLQKGGFSYAVILHEFGHAHGIAHPHDTGGGSEVMLGVTATTGSYGVYNLNQGVYTVMSYNDAWDFHPDGGSRNPATGGVGLVIERGWSSTLGAFDIAVLQARYGVQDHNTGNNVYTLTDNYMQANYQTIWDTGGNDTIAYGGALDAQIDLGAATLDYTPTGGGMVSFLYNVPQPDFTTEIKGGFTIANGVVVENATGGSGNDILIGNSANNVLTGNAGNDTLAGRGGLDLYRTGAGADTVIVSLDNMKIETKRGNLAYDIVADFDGATDNLDFSDLDAKLGTAANDAFKWIGTNANKAAGDLSYKVFDSINGAEKALGIEIDSISGAYSGKVTVVMANVDGGGVDYAVVLLGAPQLDATDFTL